MQELNLKEVEILKKPTYFCLQAYELYLHGVEADEADREKARQEVKK